MRNAGRLNLGYYPLPVEEAQNIRTLLVPSAPYAAVDPCMGDGTALIEMTKDTGARLAGIETASRRVLIVDIPVVIARAAFEGARYMAVMRKGYPRRLVQRNRQDEASSVLEAS
jgi:hypothetical protein